MVLIEGADPAIKSAQYGRLSNILATALNVFQRYRSAVGHLVETFLERRNGRSQRFSFDRLQSFPCFFNPAVESGNYRRAKYFAVEGQDKMARFGELAKPGDAFTIVGRKDKQSFAWA